MFVFFKPNIFSKKALKCFYCESKTQAKPQLRRLMCTSAVLQQLLASALSSVIAANHGGGLRYICACRLRLLTKHTP